MLVVPDVFRRAGAVEEEQVRRDGRIRREDAVGEPDDGVEVVLLEQVFLDAGADAVAEERAVRDDDAGPAAFGRLVGPVTRRKASSGASGGTVGLSLRSASRRRSGITTSVKLARSACGSPGAIWGPCRTA